MLVVAGTVLLFISPSLIHLLLVSVHCDIFRWEQQAFERSKLAFINNGQSVNKSLERASSSKIMDAMLGPDMRFR